MRNGVLTSNVGTIIQAVPAFIGLNAISNAFIGDFHSLNHMLSWFIISTTFLLLIYDAVEEYSQYKFEDLNVFERWSIVLYTVSLVGYTIALSQMVKIEHGLTFSMTFMLASLSLSALFEVCFCSSYYINYSDKKESIQAKESYKSFIFVELFVILFYASMIAHVNYSENDHSSEVIKDNVPYVFIMLCLILLISFFERYMWTKNCE